MDRSLCSAARCGCCMWLQLLEVDDTEHKCILTSSQLGYPLLTRRTHILKYRQSWTRLLTHATERTDRCADSTYMEHMHSYLRVHPHLHKQLQFGILLRQKGFLDSYIFIASEEQGIKE